MSIETEQDDNTNEEGEVIEGEDTEQVEAQDNEQQDTEQEAEEESGEVVVSIGDEAPPVEEAEKAPEWVRDLRKTNRELQRQNRELQTRLQSTAQPDHRPVALGKKPTLEDPTGNPSDAYDAEKFEEALASWFERKRQVDEAAAKQAAELENQQKAWQSKLDEYGKAKAGLKVKDFEDAEAVAQEMFNVTQQGIVLQGADNPAIVIYALGKNPKKAQEMAGIKDPVKFAFAVAKLEKDLKVTNRKPAPPPEKVVTGTGRSSGSVDSTLERLREEAARTGNMTKVIAYKRQKKA